MPNLVPVESLYRRVGARAAQAAAARPEPAYLYLSVNAKTGVSVNVSIHGSCQPTAACMRYCYGLTGNIATTGALGRQSDNLRVALALADAPQARVDAVAAALALDVERAGRTWVRWHGVGDLLPGTVRVINALARLRPDIIQWVVTRKPTEARALDDAPSIRLLVSLDETTPAPRAAALLGLRARFARTRVRIAWVRSDERLAPDGVDVVFNEHHSNSRLRVETRDPRTCAATEPGNSHADTCETCRRCFA